MKAVKVVAAIVLFFVPLVGKVLISMLYPDLIRGLVSYIMRVKFNPLSGAWRRFQQRQAFGRMRSPWEEDRGLKLFYERH
jgi:hypothetical protein